MEQNDLNRGIRTAVACPSGSINKQATPHVKEGRRMAATCHR